MSVPVSPTPEEDWAAVRAHYGGIRDTLAATGVEPTEAMVAATDRLAASSTPDEQAAEEWQYGVRWHDGSISVFDVEAEARNEASYFPNYTLVRRPFGPWEDAS